MLEKSDYLKIGKVRTNCVACGKSLLESESHTSILLSPEEVAELEGAKDAAAMEGAPETGESAQPHKPNPSDPSNPSKVPTAPPKTSENPDDEDGPGYERRDFCPECWKQRKEEAYFSFWIGKQNTSALPPKKLNRVERNLALAALFDSLTERHNSDDDDTDYTPHLYFLAHLLMKFKILKWLPSTMNPETGQTMLRFSRAHVEEEIQVPDMEMHDEMIVRIKNEVEEYLRQTTGQVVKI